LNQARADRAAAVKFAERKSLANQSMFKAQIAMDAADEGMTAASASALQQKQLAQNANMDKVNAKKILVDVQEEYTKAVDDLVQGHVDLNKAGSQLSQAKCMHSSELMWNASKEHLAAAEGTYQTKQEQKLIVKTNMEDAYIAATSGANESTAPSYGIAGAWSNADEALGPYDVPVTGAPSEE